jgi:beta-galactosidase/beta-glucuronidase
MVRDSYLNLNGKWEYVINRSEELPETYEGEILVPFSPEAVLSGVNRQVMPEDVLHYRRTVALTQEFLNGGRVLLHFGAVDQICQVYVNGILAGSHTGGYLPFTIEVTGKVKEGENVLQVVVRDYSDTSYHARGKQKIERGGMWYTPQSGIWQTVWMESVPQDYIRELKITPCYDEGAVKLRVFTDSGREETCTGSISFRGKLIRNVTFKANRTVKIRIEDFESWTPETPNLYDMTIRTETDAVETYFAMRKYSMERDGKGVLRFCLNNRPYLHNGLLDQGYYPDGLYTAPSDEALQYDIRKMKELGFNMLRKHIKIEPARWYYHCDRIGMLVWQDMVSGGGKYHMKFICTMPNMFMWSGRIVKDNKYRAFARSDREGREEYYRELKAMIRHLYNYPCITAWVPFNEGWGQFDAAKATEMVRQMDPSRLIDEASGWFDQHGGDMYSIHNYWRVLKVKPKKDRAVALTECGGYSYRMEGRSYCDEVYGYRKYYSVAELTDGIRGLWEKELMANIKNGLSAIVYTQVSDVEEEVNGLVTYDREAVKVEEEAMKDLNRRLYHVFEESV